jgi:hypothetical protein
MYLILGDKTTTIEGTKGDSFTYQWNVTKTNTQPPPIQLMTTQSETNTITFKLNGDVLTGTWDVKQSFTCVGGMCGTSNPNCNWTDQLKGRHLDIDRLKVY